MIFHVLTVFPELVAQVFQYGVVRRGVEAGTISHNIRDLRDFTTDKHKSVDDQPFGGGPGMVMLPDPIFKGVEAMRTEAGAELPVILTSPSGEKFSHGLASELAGGGDFLLLCGRYEGIDQRVVANLVDREISLGDYVLSGGELAAMCIIDAVSRLIPGVVGNSDSWQEDSFFSGLLDWPHYTRPEHYRGFSVPAVLLSGNHAKIAGFRREEALILTYLRRRELLDEGQIAEAERILLRRSQEENGNANAD